MNRLLMMLFVAVVLLPLAAHADWILDTPLAPTVTTFAADSVNGHFLAGLESGGLWESRGGDLWFPAHAFYGFTRHEGIRDIQVYDAFGDSILIEAVDNQTGARRYQLSTDGGLQ